VSRSGSRAPKRTDFNEAVRRGQTRRAGQFIARIKGGRALIYRPETTANKIAGHLITSLAKRTFYRRRVLSSARKQNFVNVVNTRRAAHNRDSM